MKILRNLIIWIFVLSIFPLSSFGKLTPKYTSAARLVTQPAARKLIPDQVEIWMNFYHSGGVMGSVKYSISDRIAVGVSYGGLHILDNVGTDWNNMAGFYAEYTLCHAFKYWPLVALGAETQGWGSFKRNILSGENRYFIKAPGIYLVAGRSLNICRSACFTVQGGVSYNVFENDDDSSPNLFFGFEKTIIDIFSFAVEYDLALNDNSDKALGKGKGYLNTAFRLHMNDRLDFEFLVLDIMVNNSDARNETKMFRIVLRNL
ncbi:hypothetical protein ISS30_11505 [bacterium]|nr:hypothetical protein [FCB group bacterium]MBL7192305.1 hypothetical protein [bacterium]